MVDVLKEEIILENRILSKFDKGAYEIVMRKEIWCEEVHVNEQKRWHAYLQPADWWQKGDAIAFSWGKSISDALRNLLKHLEDK